MQQKGCSAYAPARGRKTVSTTHVGSTCSQSSSLVAEASDGARHTRVRGTVGGRKSGAAVQQARAQRRPHETTPARTVAHRIPARSLYGNLCIDSTPFGVFGRNWLRKGVGNVAPIIVAALRSPIRIEMGFLLLLLLLDESHLFPLLYFIPHAVVWHCSDASIT